MERKGQGPREDRLAINEEQSVAPEYDAKSVPADMTVAETEAWVDGDSRRARAALEAENKRKDPRSTVVSSLERLASDQTGRGIATGEA